MRLPRNWKFDQDAIWWPVWTNLMVVPPGCQFGQFWSGCHLVASLGKFDVGATWWPVWANLIKVPSGGQFGKIWSGCHLVANLIKVPSGDQFGKNWYLCQVVVSFCKFDRDSIWWPISFQHFVHYMGLPCCWSYEALPMQSCSAKLYIYEALALQVPGGHFLIVLTYFKCLQINQPLTIKRI